MKKKMSWEFYSKRRNLTLEKFIKGLETIDDVHKKFNKEGVEMPLDHVELDHACHSLFAKKHERDSATVLKPNDIVVETRDEDLEYLKKNLFDSLKMPEIFVSVVNSDEKQHENEEKTLQVNHKNFKKSKK